MKLNTAFAVAILLPTDVLHGGTTEQSGRVLSAGTPIAFATVVLGSAVADADGSFTITYTPRRGSSAVLSWSRGLEHRNSRQRYLLDWPNRRS